MGLGIARNIARAHGGDVLLRNRAEGGLEALVVLGQSPPEAQDDGARLPRRAAAVGGDEDVHLAAGVGDFEGSEDRLAVALAGEVFVEGPAVNLDAAGTCGDPDAGDGALAAADAPDVRGLGARAGVGGGGGFGGGGGQLVGHGVRFS